jgi:hypothetical protein
VLSLWQRLRQGRHRWPLRLAALLVLGVALFVWFVWGRSPNHLTVENRSGLPVTVLRVTVGGDSYTLRDVASGADATAPLTVKGGERFAVEGKLADGTLIRAGGQTGDSAHLLVLPGGEVQFRPARKGFPF